MKLMEKEAIEKAISDWENQCAVYLTNCCIRFDIPVFDKNLNFIQAIFMFQTKVMSFSFKPITTKLMN